MKKISAVFLAVIAAVATALSVSSCELAAPYAGSDDPIVGIWQCVSADYGTSSEVLGLSFFEGNKLILKDDGSYYVQAYYDEERSWKREGNNLKLVCAGRTTVLNITELADDRLFCYQYYQGYTFKFRFARY